MPGQKGSLIRISFLSFAKVGMVQVCLQLLDSENAEIQQVRPNVQAISSPDQGSCKTTLLDHKSGFYHYLSILFRLPLLLLRLDSESQDLSVVLHQDFEVNCTASICMTIYAVCRSCNLFHDTKNDGIFPTYVHLDWSPNHGQSCHRQDPK